MKKDYFTQFNLLLIMVDDETFDEHYYYQQVHRARWHAAPIWSRLHIPETWNKLTFNTKQWEKI